MIIRTLAAAAVLSLAATACSQQPDTAKAPAVQAAASLDVTPIRIGDLQAWALKDGGMSLSAADAPWADKTAIASVLQAAGAQTVDLSIQPLLVRDGDRVVLIDAGAGGGMGTEGKLVASLKAAGVQPEQVTDVLITHAHGDHVGGLARGGALTFPNAVIRMSASEWTFAREDELKNGAQALLAAITPKVQTFEPGAQITPAIRAVPLDGHTPGHTGYQIASGGQMLLVIGDALHSSLVSVSRPDLANDWDSDKAAGAATRADLLARAADGNLRLYAGHFPYPGVGRIARRGEGYVWVPEAASAGR